MYWAEWSRLRDMLRSRGKLRVLCGKGGVLSFRSNAHGEVRGTTISDLKNDAESLAVASFAPSRTNGKATLRRTSPVLPGDANHPGWKMATSTGD